MNKKLLALAAKNAGGVLIYVALVSLLLNNGEYIFGQLDRGHSKFIAPIAFILIFIISALTTGYLVLGKPIMMYIDGEKKDGVKLLFYTAACLISILLIMFIAGLLLML